MADPNNPFGEPIPGMLPVASASPQQPQQHQQPAASGNPFDPFASQTSAASMGVASPPPQQSYPGVAPQQQHQPPSSPFDYQQPTQYAASPAVPAPVPAPAPGYGQQANPFEAQQQAPPPQSQYQAPPPATNDPFGYQQPQVQVQQQFTTPQKVANPSFDHSQQQLSVTSPPPSVVSEANPYGGTSNPTTQPQAAGGYDPFGGAPVPVPVPQPVQPPPNPTSGSLVISQQQSNPYAGLVAPVVGSDQPHQHQHQQQQYGQALVPAVNPNATQWGAPPVQHNDPWGAPTASIAPPPAAPPQSPQDNYNNNASQSSQQYSQGGGNVEQQNHEPPATPQSSHQTQLDSPYSERNPSHQSTAMVSATENRLTAGTESRNKFSQELARQAPPGASALPKADLVKKSGYVLSRISFRTIVMKKWKQAFWVQYGSHTMLWFRSQSDFDDWLNNPYHTQTQRNFLIKLAVNFVHDLYKPNVRGYQVTQCRTKPYGNKTVRQFKLERWMDYGPTIAAAFGSYDPKEIDALRAAIVECMRNTPLEGGIRATGAVRQDNPHMQGEQPSNGGGYGAEGGNGGGQAYNNYTLPAGYAANQAQQNQIPPPSQNAPPQNRQQAQSVGSAQDLLDFANDNNVAQFDDSSSLPGQIGRGAGAHFNDTASLPGGMDPAYGSPPQQQYGAAPPNQHTYQQQGAPQQPYQQQGYPPQNGYEQQNPYGAPYQQQQQPNPGNPYQQQPAF